MFPQKVAVREMNPHLICTLCGGYFIDATTIIECLHSFCKSCIVRHLETSKYCPICDVQVHKSRPLENIRRDHILQEIVYKLVPGLYQNEMRSRREFYQKHAENVPTSLEAKGEISEDCSIFLPEESIMLSLEYNSDDSPSKSHESSCGKRYLQCPAAVTILHLQKLIRSKFGLTPDCKVDFFCKDKLLPEFLSLLDIAYIFQWKRKTPLHLSYQILEVKKEIIKVESVKSEDPAPFISSECEKASSSGSSSEVKKEKKEKWEEVELQISENGVMSAAASSKSSANEKPTTLLRSNLNEKSTAPLRSGLNEKSPAPLKSSLKEKSTGLESSKSIKTEVKREDVKTTAPESGKGSERERSAGAVKESPKVAVKPKVEIEEIKKETQPQPHMPVKNSCEISVTTTRSSVHTPSSSKTSQRDSFDNVKADVSISISKETAPKVQESPKATDKVDKSREVQKQEFDEQKVRFNDNKVKPETIWKHGQTPDSSKKVCKVEPSLMGLPCGLSIIQRPIMKTYPGLKPINSGKEAVDGIKAIAGLSKEVSIKPIVSISTSSAALPNKTNVSCSLEIPSSAPPIVPPSLSKKPTPIRYKTLKSPTKPWNPSIARSSMLMMKQNHDDPNVPKANQKPPKFFKMRNVPRFLGAPASGVKPLYQATEASSVSCETQSKIDLNTHKSGTNSVTLMKIDPKTLSPIVASSACPSPSRSLSPNSVSHPKKSPLPPPYTPGLPKQSPVSKSKPVINNKTPAHGHGHGTPIPSPAPALAHSNSLLSSNSFFSAANPLIYPGFAHPHPFSHPESANRFLASAAATSPELMRAMSSLCTPSFHPSLSMLFNSHQPGFPRLNPPTKPTSKTLSSKQSPPISSTVPISISVSSPNTHTPSFSKPKKPATSEQMRVRPISTVETSRYNSVYVNGFLSSPTERHLQTPLKTVAKFECDKKPASKAESMPKSRPNTIAAPIEKVREEKMDVDVVEPPKKEGKKTLDCDKDTPVTSNKRLKKDNPVESNNNFKVDTSLVSKNVIRTKVSPPASSKDSSDSKPESNTFSRLNESNLVHQLSDPGSTSQSKESVSSHQSTVSNPVNLPKESSLVNASNESNSINPPNESNLNNQLNESASGIQSTESSAGSEPKNSNLVSEPIDSSEMSKTNNSMSVSHPAQCSSVDQSKDVALDKDKKCDESRSEIKGNSCQDESKKENGCSLNLHPHMPHDGNKNEIDPTSKNSTVESTSSEEKGDAIVIQNDNNKNSTSQDNSLKGVAEIPSKGETSSKPECLQDQTNQVVKSQLNLNAVNNNCKTACDTKQIESLATADAIPHVN